MRLSTARRRSVPATVVAGLLAALVSAPVSGAEEPGRPWMDTSLGPDRRAELLVDAMTLEERGAMLFASGQKRVDGEVWQVYVKGNDRLGIPDLTMADGATGLRGGTQLPAPVALGASFSRADAQTYGQLLGTETRALGYDVLLAPTANLARSPLHGRTFEAFGEDPYLMGGLAAPETRAIQDAGAIADVKHFAVNNLERFRTSLDAGVDERTLNELYLPHFKDAVRAGGADSVMCAFNKINGVYGCDSGELMTELLRERWGFKGFVRTDANANHGLSSLEAGLDIEMPRELAHGEELLSAVRSGRIPERRVNTAAHHVLRTMFKHGLFDTPTERTGVDVGHGMRVARGLAERSTVLLKNAGGMLPLDAGTTGSLAVIGADADSTATYGGGSSNIAPAKKDTILDGIRERVPDAEVTYAPGTDVVASAVNAPGYDITPSSVLRSDDGRPGLTATYYRGEDFTRPSATRVEPGAYQDTAWYADGGTSLPKPPPGTRAARWTGTLTAPADGTYGFDLASWDSSRLFLDGRQIVGNSGVHADDPKRAQVELKKGEAHEVRVEWVPFGDNPHVDEARWLKFGWQPPAGGTDPAIAEAAATAKEAGTAVIVARDYSSEGQDKRTLRLRNHQDELIEAVTAANPRTVVVLTTGTAVTMPWLDDVPAVVEAWYGGSSHGAALARVLFGDADPGGRLPVSFPRSDAAAPTGTDYDEGMEVGYRDPDADPLFPFGHGLSYTSFAYGPLTVDRDAFDAAAAAAHGGLEDARGVRVSFDVTNTGERTGWAVPQLYVTAPDSADEPAPQLKGFDKIRLEPGRTRRVTLELPQQAFAQYRPAADQWAVEPGDYGIRVGGRTAEVTVARSAGAPHLDVGAPAVADPGDTVTVSGRAVNDGDSELTGIRAALDLPAGWKAEGGGVPERLAPHGSAPVRWQVRIPDDARAAGARIGARLSFTARGDRTSSITRDDLAVAAPSLDAARNATGVTAEADPAGGSLDGQGHALSAEALSEAGYVGGEQVTAAGVDFTWPQTGSGRPDHLAPEGQAFRIDGRGDTLSLLATSTMKPTAGPLTVVYADGSTDRRTLRVGDWWQDRPADGSRSAVTLPRVTSSTDQCGGEPVTDGVCEHPVTLYVADVPVDRGRKVAAVITPRLTSAGPIPALHLFAAAVH